jgi:hypothetical protein
MEGIRYQFQVGVETENHLHLHLQNLMGILGLQTNK